MTDLHSWFDGIQSLGVVGVAIIWVYNQLKKPESLEKDQEELVGRIDDMDQKLTTAMTHMARQVGSLANSVSKLEGQFDVFRNPGR